MKNPSLVAWVVVALMAGAASAAEDPKKQFETATAVPAATKMPADVQAFDGVSGISSDRMTLFTELNFGTHIMTRTSLSQPFTVPATSMPPGAAWRIVPIANCAKLIGTCEPGGCSNEDICTWTAM